MATFVLILGLLVFAGHFLQLLFRHTHIPDVLMLTLLGVIVGPVLGWIGPQDLGKLGPIMATVALVTILFESGTSLSFADVGRAAGPTTALALVSFAITAALVAGVTIIGFDFSPMEGALTGMILGGTSSAVVIPMVRALAPSPGAATVLVLESAFTDVISIVGVFALMGILTGGSAAPLMVSLRIGAAFLGAGIVGLLGGIGWMAVMRRIRGFPNTISSTLAYAFIVYGVTEMVGFSGAIAVLCLGIALANHQTIGWPRPRNFAIDTAVLTDEDKNFYQEMVFLLKIYFFIYLGISMHFSDLQYVWYAIALISAVMILRGVVVRLTLRNPTYALRDRMLAAALAPKGLAAAVLASVPLQQGIANGQTIRDFSYIVVLVSIVMCALAVMTQPMRIFQKMYCSLHGGRADCDAPSA